MQFELNTKIVINVESSSLSEITTAFLKSLAPVFELLVNTLMLHYRDVYAKNGVIFTLLGLEKGDSWSWKSKNGYTKITLNSLFGKIVLVNPVVKIRKKDGTVYSKVLGRKLLSISSYAQIPDFMKNMIGVLGGLISFRNVEKSMQVFGIFRISLGSIWRTMEWSAKRLSLSFLRQEDSQDEILEADGTGICTLHSGKRGSEAKVLMQRKEGGGLHFLGVSVGKYGNKEGWEGLFVSIKEIFKTSKRCILVADGDQTIMEVFKTVSLKSYTLFQRCLWHIPHQVKYMLWKDKASKADREEILSLTYNAFLLRKNVSLEEFEAYISMKLLRIENLLIKCQTYGFKACLTFLQNAKDHAFLLGRSTNDNHNTSLTERTMRTIKQRTRYAVWSEKGAENVIKIRLNHFYNHKAIGLYLET